MAAGDDTHAPPATIVASFCAATSVSAPEAAAFLESHDWALEPALHSFYESRAADADGPDPSPQPSARALSDLVAGKRAAGSDGDGDSDWEHSEWVSTFYTGGESGMVFRDRSKQKNVMDEVFKQAKRKRLTVDTGPLRNFDGPEHAFFVKEPIKPPAPSQQVRAATFPDHPSKNALIEILRRYIQGDTPPWIHKASPYGDDPMSLTSRYLKATDEKGDPAWYFVWVPQKKQSKGSRISRVAGAGTWKEDRKKGLSTQINGVSVRVGWEQSFGFVLKTRPPGEKKDTVTRLGWLMLEISLNEGEDPEGRYIAKVYPTTRTSATANLPIPMLAVLSPSPAHRNLRMPGGAAAAAHTTNPNLRMPGAAAAAAAHHIHPNLRMPGGAAAAAHHTNPNLRMPGAAAAHHIHPNLRMPGGAAAAAHHTNPNLRMPGAAAAAAAHHIHPNLRMPGGAAAAAQHTNPNLRMPGAAATAAQGIHPQTTVPAAVIAAAVTKKTTTTTAARPTPTADNSSPPKRWVRVLISRSPTRCSDNSSVRRVYCLAEEAEWVAPPPSKRTKLLDCKGWLTIEPAQ